MHAVNYSLFSISQVLDARDGAGAMGLNEERGSLVDHLMELCRAADFVTSRPAAPSHQSLCSEITETAFRNLCICTLFGACVHAVL
jgi:hypothetical protein